MVKWCFPTEKQQECFPAKSFNGPLNSVATIYDEDVSRESSG